MASFPVSKHLDLRLNLYNLTNDYYFDRLAEDTSFRALDARYWSAPGFRF